MDRKELFLRAMKKNCFFLRLDKKAGNKLKCI